VADKSKLFDFLEVKTREVLISDAGIDEKLKSVCKLLKDYVSYYNWVGFYFVDKKRKNELALGPFEGEPTEHIKIPFGMGVCGQVQRLRRHFSCRTFRNRQTISRAA
jgi:GAF domain-containing protein